MSSSMEITYKPFKGSASFRERLVLATLSRIPIAIEDIRSKHTSPGLRPHEASLLRLIAKLSDESCYIEIDETGTEVLYKPGTLMGGGNLVHDCGLTRSIGYFLEPLIFLGLFGKSPLSIKLRGITNDSMDPSVDTFSLTTLPILKRFGLKEHLKLKIESRGSPPLGGGEVVLKIPIVHNSLTTKHWISKGKVKRIRGVSFSTKVSAQFENRMIQAAREIFNRFNIPDVHIINDQKSSQYGGRSPGYGISVVAETTSGCLISADIAISYPKADKINALVDEEKPESILPEDVGDRIASMVLEEIKQGGVVDSTHQGFLFLLCALCPPDDLKIRVGKLTSCGIETLRTIRDFLGVKFDITPEPKTKTVLLKCVGCGMKNLSRIVT